MDTKSLLDLAPAEGPKYRRVFGALDKAIRAGHLTAGTKLPTVRALAWDLKVTPGTVARAYQIATDEGLIEGTVGRGTYVRSQNRMLADVPENAVVHQGTKALLNFRTGHTLDVGQTEVLADLMREVLAEDTLSLAEYVRDDALDACRMLASDWLARQGVVGDRSDLVLTYGAHSSVMIALSAILHGRDPVIASTHLTYPGFRQSAHLCRARMIGVDSDDEGIIPDALEALCRSDRPQVLLISSHVHNPTCTVTSPERRREIARLAQLYDFQIIEDDVYGAMLLDRAEGFDRICPERTWHVTSLSKCFAAGLRIGFLQCPPGLGGLGIRVMQGMSLAISQILTKLVEKSFASGAVADVQAQLASENTARVEIARHVLADWDVASLNTVNYVWIEKPHGWTSSTFLSACEREGILVAAGDAFTLPGSPPPHRARLTLSAARNYDELRAGLEAVDRIVRNPPREMLT